MQKQTSSKIDMQKEFELQELETNRQKLERENAERQKQTEEYIKKVNMKLQYNRKMIKTMFNAEFFPVRGERNNKPSLTIPDQTLPIREILARFSKGLPVGVKVPIYEGEDNTLPDPKTLDLVDLQEMQEAIKGELGQIADKAVQRTKKQKEEKQEKTETI